MIDKKTQELHQENRILRFWFFNLTQTQCLHDANELMRSLFKSDEFPRGNFERIILIFYEFCFFYRLFFFY